VSPHASVRSSEEKFLPEVTVTLHRAGASDAIQPKIAAPASQPSAPTPVHSASRTPGETTVPAKGLVTAEVKIAAVPLVHAPAQRAVLVVPGPNVFTPVSGFAVADRHAAAGVSAPLDVAHEPQLMPTVVAGSSEAETRNPPFLVAKTTPVSDLRNGLATDAPSFAASAITERPASTNYLVSAEETRLAAAFAAVVSAPNRAPKLQIAVMDQTMIPAVHIPARPAKGSPMLPAPHLGDPGRGAAKATPDLALLSNDPPVKTISAPPVVPDVVASTGPPHSLVNADLSAPQPVIAPVSPPTFGGPLITTGRPQPSPQWRAQLAEIATIQPDKTVELALAPEELGRLRVTMTQDGDTIRVTLIAERPETLDLLRRHADQLGQEFRQAGFASASFTFGQWGGNAGPPPAPLTEPSPLGDSLLPPVPFSRSSAVLSAEAGLDLRL